MYFLNNYVGHKFLLAELIDPTKFTIDGSSRRSHGYRHTYPHLMAQVVSCCCVYHVTKIETGLEGQYPNLFVNWADTSLHLLLPTK